MTQTPGSSPTPPSEREAPAPARLSGMRIRKKLILLHTSFSLTLALALLLALRPAVQELVQASERRQATIAMALLAASPDAAPRAQIEDVTLRVGSAEELALNPDIAAAARSQPGEDVSAVTYAGWPQLVRFDPEREKFLVAAARSASARDTVKKLYALLTVALLAVYCMIAVMLEMFVLPRQVYGPIRRMLFADQALQAGLRSSEIIDERYIPQDELGEIMRSRNSSILRLRSKEQALAEALDQLESVAMELKRKNHLLETARRNLADQDRLASLGMMSAGIAHELNTPLAVLKGEVERLCADPTAPTRRQADLMLRVVGRLERLSESLLDFARARPPHRSRVLLRPLIEESWSLVRINRNAAGIELRNTTPPSLEILADEDRLSQVFVNLLRNASDAMEGRGRITVSTEESVRDGERWVSIRIADTGPGIDPEVLPRLFEPFTSTRMDAHGTGLGLAVSEGIIREHAGVILARNRAVSDPQGAGAVFEIMLPADRAEVSAGEKATA